MQLKIQKEGFVLPSLVLHELSTIQNDFKVVLSPEFSIQVFAATFVCIFAAFQGDFFECSLIVLN